MSPRTARVQLPLALGVSDGILNALTLASSAVLHGDGLNISLALRVGVVSFVTATFTVFVAEFAQYRGELARAEHELNFTQSGRLAKTHLGRAVARDALEAAFIAGGSSFIGAFLPLLIGAVLKGASWLALAVSIAALGGLGVALAASVRGRRTVWAGALVVAGTVVTVIGVQLHVA